MIIDESLQAYHRQAGTFKLLSYKKEKELALIIKFKQGKQKQEARETLANHNLRLVIKVAYQFYNKENSFVKGRGRSELTIMDMVNAGNIGLMKAVDMYDPKRYKTRFSTYAIPWIKQGMLSLVYSYNAGVHVPAHVVDGYMKYKSILEKNGERKVSDIKMRKLLKVTKEGLKNIKNARTYMFSGDRSINNDNGDETMTYRESLRDHKQPSPFELTADRDTAKMVKDALSVLDPVSRDIIQKQFLDIKKTKLKDLGKKHKLSGERIRQIKCLALDKIKWELKRKNLTHVEKA